MIGIFLLNLDSTMLYRFRIRPTFPSTNGAYALLFHNISCLSAEEILRTAMSAALPSSVSVAMPSRSRLLLLVAVFVVVGCSCVVQSGDIFPCVMPDGTVVTSEALWEHYNSVYSKYSSQRGSRNSYITHCEIVVLLGVPRDYVRLNN